MASEKTIVTDVLVIGGGLAACFAAIKAREQGADVTLVSKGSIGRSGQTPWADATFVYNPEWGHDFEALTERAYTRGEYINNRDWTETVVKESYTRFQDLASWGIPFFKDENGNIKRTTINRDGLDLPIMRWTLHENPGSWVQPLRSQPKKVGVHVFERIMIVDLIKQGDSVKGAIGIPNDSPDLYIFQAKATVLCTGAGGFKPVGNWPIGDLTADGHIMAYRVGAEITGKEFEDFHGGMATKKGSLYFPNLPFPPLRNAEGNEVTERGFGLNADFEAHAGLAPLNRGDDGEYSNNVAFGMSVHTAEGVWPADMDCGSGAPGLYAAGDNCATMTTGGHYGLGGTGTMAACVSGARAGQAAARYAIGSKKPSIDDREIARSKDFTLMPVKRKGGFSPKWVTQVLRNTMMPYFILRIKHEDRLRAALTMVEFMRNSLSPKLYARDPHELRLAHETKNMIINAEMKLRASLFRTESRGTHYREDYPRRHDPDWLAWVMLKEEEGKMRAYKKPIPEAWWPDLSLPYERRYPTRFPGE
jgi:succinate dehydrogenase/fumarate reductase flavoprotein subunit